METILNSKEWRRNHESGWFSVRSVFVFPGDSIVRFNCFNCLKQLFKKDNKYYNDNTLRFYFYIVTYKTKNFNLMLLCNNILYIP